MKLNRSTIIEVCACVCAAPMWLLCRTPAEGVHADWIGSNWWAFLCAVTALLFAGVETLTIKFAMEAVTVSKQKTFRVFLWCLTIACASVLVAIPTPIGYCYAVGEKFRDLPHYLIAVWSLVLSLSIPLMIITAGVAQFALVEAMNQAEADNSLNSRVDALNEVIARLQDAHSELEQQNKSLTAKIQIAHSEVQRSVEQKQLAQQNPLECPHCGATANKRGQPLLTQQALSAHLGVCPSRPTPIFTNAIVARV